MEEDLEELLKEYGIEDPILLNMEDGFDDLYVLPTQEERPTWMD